ncbi:MAG: ATP-binding cassette domain-containing protein [Corynebacterium sp.]|uniref:ABC transporter ATP-binding protein n=1 Tax=Corynebacterium sp. TaxID=1720 RepID=UPI0026DA8F19|nr:ATP-binding cassette domain-containing protein [Corynebacterium sp.]MDO5097262.1 ATP-binding cassette domain-containing protein [Corynebacterium sp.]
MITATDLNKAFDRKTLWENLSFTALNGQLTALTGPSGCGKTTLLNCLGTLDKPDSGSILVEGREVTTMNARKTRKFRATHLGYVAQDYALMDNETVAANIAVAIPLDQLHKRKQLIASALKKVGLAGYEKYPAHSLSGGEQQRVSIARLYVRKPSLILCDEPTGSLDQANAAIIINALREQADAGATVVISTHDPKVMDLCDNHIQLAKKHRS